MEAWYRWEPQPWRGPSVGRDITEGPVRRLAHPRAEQRSNCLKGTYALDEGNPFTNPQVSAKWAENCWNCLRGPRCQKVPFFVCSPYTLIVRTESRSRYSYWPAKPAPACPRPTPPPSPSCPAKVVWAWQALGPHPSPAPLMLAPAPVTPLGWSQCEHAPGHTGPHLLQVQPAWQSCLAHTVHTEDTPTQSHAFQTWRGRCFT